MGCVAKIFFCVCNFYIWLYAIAVLCHSVLSIVFEVDNPVVIKLIDLAKLQCGESYESYGSFTLFGVVVKFSTALYITITVTSLATIISSFGCFFTMDRTCFGVYLIMMYGIFLVLLVIGAMLGYLEGDVVEKMEISLDKSLGSYRDNATTPQEIALKDTWNQIQFELKCCGVHNVDDWRTDIDKFGFPHGSEYNKPEGCCRVIGLQEDLTLMRGGVDFCRMSKMDGSSEIFYFEGCLTKWRQSIQYNAKTGILIFTISIMSLPCLALMLAVFVCSSQDD